MSTDTSALVVLDITGRPRGGVRIHRPSPGKRSFRILWTDDDGRQRERTRISLEEAENLAEAIALDLIRQRVDRPSGDVTLGDLLVHYLDGPGRSPRWTSEKSERRPAEIARRTLTADDLNIPAREYCTPHGRLRLQEILNRAAVKGCTPGGSEYAKAGGLLKTLFDVGHRDNLLVLPSGNPMQELRYRLHEFSASPNPQMLTVHFIGPELRPGTDRVLDFIAATERMFGNREARYVEALAFGGLRPGEANALTPEHLRTDRPGLLIARQLLELTPKEAAKVDGRTQQFRPPKWGQTRNAYYPSEYLGRLFDLAEREPLGPHRVLFPTTRGTLRRQNNWRRDVFNVVAAHVGWPSENVYVRGRMERHWVWPPYGFRHHYANYMLKDLRQPLVSVARWMGHRDSRVTELMYLKTELDDLTIAEQAYVEHQKEAS